MEIVSRFPLSLWKFGGGEACPVGKQSRWGQEGFLNPGHPLGKQNQVSDGHPSSRWKSPESWPPLVPFKHSRHSHRTACREATPGLSSNCSLCVFPHLPMLSALLVKVGLILNRRKADLSTKRTLPSPIKMDKIFKKKTVLASVQWDRGVPTLPVGQQVFQTIANVYTLVSQELYSVNPL